MVILAQQSAAVTSGSGSSTVYFAQQFTTISGGNYLLDSIKLQLSEDASGTSTVSVQVRDSSGTLIEESSNLEVSGGPGASQYTFNFSGTNQLNGSTQYYYVVNIQESGTKRRDTGVWGSAPYSGGDSGSTTSLSIVPTWTPGDSKYFIVEGTLIVNTLQKAKTGNACKPCLR